MGFDIMNLQKGRGPVQARSKADEGRAVLKYIDVDDLVPSEDNFYSMSAIDELAAHIELSGGVKQPALVMPLGGGKYRIIAGHRRRLASLQLVKQGKEAYRKMPCIVEADRREPGADADERRDIDEAILLITTNSQREKTDWDKVQEVTRLRELLERKRRFEKIPGETRRLIAEQLGTTPAQVGRYDSIDRRLITPLKEWLEQGKIGISVAYELSTLPEDVQNGIMLEHWGNCETVTLEDVRKWKLAAEQEKNCPASDAAVLPKKPEDEDNTPKVEQTNRPAVEHAGKVVDFPALPSPVLAPSAEIVPEKEPLSAKRAVYILEDLQMYCEEMSGIDAEQPEMWAERAAALDAAISVLRKAR